MRLGIIFLIFVEKVAKKVFCTAVGGGQWAVGGGRWAVGRNVSLNG
jgi:hypothetical protein